MSHRSISSRLLAVSMSLLVAASCGDDQSTDPLTTSPPPSTVANTTAESASTNPVDEPLQRVPEACALLPAADVSASLGVEVDEGLPAGDDRRRVCTFQGMTEPIGLTVGIEAGSRFDDKAEASRRSLDVDGVEIPDLGDRALFFFSDADIEEGVGGTLVALGDLTIDVTLQALDEATMRNASIAIAEVTLSNL